LIIDYRSERFGEVLYDTDTDTDTDTDIDIDIDVDCRHLALSLLKQLYAIAIQKILSNLWYRTTIATRNREYSVP